MGFVLHARNTITASAAEGARLGARADGSLDDGVARTRELIDAQLSPRFAQHITATEELSGGVRVVVVHVEAPVPVFGPLGVGQDLSVTARAFSERQ